jgi:hypothetical protein
VRDQKAKPLIAQSEAVTSEGLLRNDQPRLELEHTCKKNDFEPAAKSRKMKCNSASCEQIFVYKKVASKYVIHQPDIGTRTKHFGIMQNSSLD